MGELSAGGQGVGGLGSRAAAVGEPGAASAVMSDVGDGGAWKDTTVGPPLDMSDQPAGGPEQQQQQQQQQPAEQPWLEHAGALSEAAGQQESLGLSTAAPRLLFPPSEARANALGKLCGASLQGMYFKLPEYAAWATSGTLTSSGLLQRRLVFCTCATHCCGWCLFFACTTGGLAKIIMHMLF